MCRWLPIFIGTAVAVGQGGHPPSRKGNAGCFRKRYKTAQIRSLQINLLFLPPPQTKEHIPYTMLGLFFFFFPFFSPPPSLFIFTIKPTDCYSLPDSRSAETWLWCQSPTPCRDWYVGPQVLLLDEACPDAKITKGQDPPSGRETGDPDLVPVKPERVCVTWSGFQPANRRLNEK